MAGEKAVIKAAQMFTKTGQASKVSAAKEIIIGSILGVSFGMLWQNWHWAENKKWEDYYKALNAKK